LHLCEPLPVQHAYSLRGRRHVTTDKVRMCKQVIESDKLGLELRKVHVVAAEQWVACEDLHAERLRTSRGEIADFSQSHNAQGFSIKFVAEVAMPTPATPFRVRVGRRNAACQRQ